MNRTITATLLSIVSLGAVASPCHPAVPVKNTPEFCSAAASNAKTVMEMRQFGVSREDQERLWFSQDLGGMGPQIRYAIDMSYHVSQVPEWKRDLVEKKFHDHAYIVCSCVEIGGGS